MACFADINVLQGSVATYAMCGKICDIHLTEKFTKECSSEKKFLNRLRIDRIVVMSVVHPVVDSRRLRLNEQRREQSCEGTLTTDIRRRLSTVEFNLTRYTIVDAMLKIGPQK